MPGACNYSPQFISRNTKTQYPWCSFKKYIYFPLKITKYHLPWKCALNSRVKLSKYFCQVVTNVNFCFVVSTRSKTDTVCSSSQLKLHQPTVNFYLRISLFSSELSKIKVPLVKWIFVFRHFHNQRMFWGREEQVGEVVCNSLHLPSSYFNTIQLAFYLKDLCMR